ncbi:hypothetical protein BFL38_07660 [Brachyspira hampsonii]|uniref:Uncharacterized protein n=1 Tax=Brachyspira hampsonii TaxID=1287055 RepID=A0A1E5NEV8_9SPIR|nr:hypothetical protein [Brachyspira hampsonii]OEJ14710.1 hypothetical protein BFL38_07660 [Brachyspira hampsonii]
MEENSIQNNNANEKTNTINDINSKIGKILENNLISNLIIIFIGLISSAFITGTVLMFMNNRISRFITDSEYLFNLITSFVHLFYFLSLSLIFYINKNFNLKNILITFLSVIFILIVDLSTSFFIRNVAIDNNDFFVQISIIKYIFNNIIFFIIIALSYNGFQILNSKTISEFFTFSADISIFAGLIVGIVSTVFGIFAAIVLFLMKDIIGFINEDIIIKLAILSMTFFTSLFPFLVYIVYQNMKTNISIYLSRILMPFSLLFIFILLILLLMPDIRPYDNRVTFILYNIMLAIIVLNMFFIRIDYKSSIFTKALYIVLPIIAIIFDILVLTSSLYRLIEYGISPNKITLIGTNLVMLGNLIFITFFNIKSILIIFKKPDSIPNIKEITIGDTKSVFFIYIYGIWAFIVCFIIPILFSLFK